MAKIIDGKKIAAEVRADIKRRAAEFAAETGITPGLAVVIVGNDPASKVYVRNKGLACIEAGFKSLTIEMPENSKAYNRNKTRNWKRDYHEPIPGIALFI